MKPTLIFFGLISGINVKESSNKIIFIVNMKIKKQRQIIQTLFPHYNLYSVTWEIQKETLHPYFQS